MYDIIFSDSALKQLEKLDKHTQKRILSALERIRIRPEHYLTKLVSDPGHRLRVGDYRIIVDLNQNTLTILVIKIGQRKNIYK